MDAGRASAALLLLFSLGVLAAKAEEWHANEEEPGEELAEEFDNQLRQQVRLKRIALTS